MRDSAGPAPKARALLVAALATLGLFAAHHVYGAVRYATPWRHHAAVVAFWVGLALLTAFLVHRRRRDAPLGRLAGWTLLVVAVAFPVLVVGLFEGLYNHVAKDVLFLSSAPPSLLLRDPTKVRQLSPSRRIVVDSAEALVDLAASGAGLAWMCGFMAAHARRSEGLVEVVEETACEESQIHVLSLPARRVLPKVRAFVDFVAAELAGSGRRDAPTEVMATAGRRS